MWSYGNSAARLPAPRARRCASRPARPVTVVLHNTLPEATSIVFPGPEGREGQRQPGPAPVRPRRLAHLAGAERRARRTARSPTRSPPAAPGTYLYESGTDVNKQVQMGLYGALVVRPGRARRPGQRPRRLGVQPRARVRLPALRGRPRPAPGRRARPSRSTGRRTQPRYFMINGRSMPDTLAPNNASWLPNQPYGALVHIQPLRRGHQPAAGRDPLPQRRHGQLPVPPARQRRARRQQGRPRRCRARPARTCRTSSTTSTCSPGRRSTR